MYMEILESMLRLITGAGEQERFFPRGWVRTRLLSDFCITQQSGERRKSERLCVHLVMGRTCYARGVKSTRVLDEVTPSRTQKTSP